MSSIERTENGWQKLAIPPSEAKSIETIEDLFSWVLNTIKSEENGVSPRRVEMMYIDPDLECCSIQSNLEFEAWKAWNGETGAESLLWYRKTIQMEGIVDKKIELLIDDDINQSPFSTGDKPFCFLSEPIFEDSEISPLNLSERSSFKEKAKKAIQYNCRIIATHPLLFQNVTPSEFTVRLRWTVINLGHFRWNSHSIRFLPLNLSPISILSVRIPFCKPKESGFVQVVCRIHRPPQMKVLYFHFAVLEEDTKERGQRQRLFGERFLFELNSEQLETQVLFHEAYQMCDSIQLNMSKARFHSLIHNLQKQWKMEFSQRIRTSAELVSYIIEQNRNGLSQKEGIAQKEAINVARKKDCN
jgi:hypothetical protein